MVFPQTITPRATDHKPTGGADEDTGTYNTDRRDILQGRTPAQTDDLSANVAAMQATKDAGEDGTEVLSVTLEEEVQMIRQLIKEITGKTYWYETPANTLGSLGAATIEHENLAPRLGEIGRTGQTVVATADDDCIIRFCHFDSLPTVQG